MCVCKYMTAVPMGEVNMPFFKACGTPYDQAKHQTPYDQAKPTQYPQHTHNNNSVVCECHKPSVWRSSEWMPSNSKTVELQGMD